jgi:excisionase family DNA binding protein
MKKNALFADPSAPAELLTADEVGRRLRLPLSTVYHLAKTGKLPAVQFGRSWRFPAASIERLGSATPSLRVLVVDDDAVTCGLVSSALEPSGCQVSEAGSVGQALQFCHRHRFDVMFIDLKLPDRDGTELIRELLGEYSLNQIVVITAYPDISLVGELLKLGPVTLLCKPLAVAQLLECVQRITGIQLVPASSNNPAANHRALDYSGQEARLTPLKQTSHLSDKAQGHS